MGLSATKRQSSSPGASKVADGVRLARTAATAALIGLAMALPAAAQDVADFYTGKTVTLINGFPPGGPAQASVDIFIKHLENHIPGNPNVISENMPGAGTLRAANYVFNAAAQDGTVIGLFSANAILAPLWQEEGAEFDPRAVGWLGSPSRRPTAIAIFRTDAPAKTYEEAMAVPVTVGSTGSGAASSVYARLLNAMTGTRFELVLGYDGDPRIMLAIEQGEVDGRLGYSWGSLKERQGHLLDDGTLHVLAQLSVIPDPELTEMGVPLALDYASDPEDRRILSFIFGLEEMQRPYAAPPGVPADRLAALRQAVEDTTRDPAYIAEVTATLPDPIALTTGAEIQAFVEDAYSLPPELIDHTIKLMRGED